jgi:O-antigen/teichoic acid export membrane protein
MRGVHLVRLDALTWTGLSSLRDRFVHGRLFQAASLSMVAQIVSQVIRLGGNLIMTRLLAPEMFGLMSLVLMIHVVLVLLSDIGLRPAIIQSRRGDDPDFLNTVWTVQVLRGASMLVACLLIAGGLVLARDFDLFAPNAALASPELPLVLIVASLGGVIGGFQSSNHITASRNLNLRGIIIIDLAAQIGGLILMIALGLLTRSIWSLVAAGIFSAGISTALSHIYLPGIKNRFTLNREALAEVYKFGIWILVSSMTFVLAANLDRAYLGAVVSASTLGIYAIAQNLYSAVDGLISRLFEGVVLPALSEASRTSPARLREQLMRIRPPFDIWYLGSAGLLFALGPSIVHLLYDDRYATAGTMLQILSFSLVFARYNVFNMAYLAVGKSEYQASINFVKLAAIAATLPLLFNYYGIEGAIYAVAFSPIATLPLHYLYARRLELCDLKYELLVLPAWPAGYICGLAFLELVRLVAG